MASSHNVHGDGVATDGAIGPLSGLFTEDTIDSQIPTINNDDNGMSNNVIDSNLTNIQASETIGKSNTQPPTIDLRPCRHKYIRMYANLRHRRGEDHTYERTHAYK